MPNKNKGNDKATKKRKNFRILLIALLLVAVGVLVFYTIDTAKKVQRLNTAGKKLDSLQTEIINSGIDLSLYRDKYCWRTQEKFSNGSRYCVQRIIAVGVNKTVAIQKFETNRIVNLLEGSLGTSIDDIGFYTYSESGSAIENRAISYSKNNSNCLLKYRGYDSTNNDSTLKNTYAIDMMCLEYLPVLGIYPFSGHGNPDWEWYTKNKTPVN